MKMRTFSYLIAGATLAGLVIGNRNSQENSQEINLSVKNSAEDVPFGPVYSTNSVPANMCSRYVRVAAKDLFGIQYPHANAWDIRDHATVSEIPIKSKEELIKLAKEGFMKRGMALGLYNPKSKYNDVARDDGAGYTHVALYLGMDKEGKMYFADKFGKETRERTSLDELLEKGNLQPRELLFLNNQ